MYALVVVEPTSAGRHQVTEAVSAGLAHAMTVRVAAAETAPMLDGLDLLVVGEHPRRRPGPDAPPSGSRGWLDALGWAGRGIPAAAFETRTGRRWGRDLAERVRPEVRAGAAATGRTSP